jgi:hypothetical protein
MVPQRKILLITAESIRPATTAVSGHHGKSGEKYPNTLFRLDHGNWAIV